MRAPERLGLALLPLMIAGGACAAEPAPQQRLHSVEQAIGAGRARQEAATKAAASAAAELADLRAQSVKVAAAVTASAAALDAGAAQLRSLAAEANARRAVLAQDAAQERTVLMALVHVAATPRAAWVLGPASPTDAMRGALLMGHAVPVLDARAAKLKSEVAALDATLSAEATARAAQAAKQQSLAAEQARLATLVARKTALAAAAQSDLDETRRQLASLVAEASGLRDLVARLEARRRAKAQRRGAAAAPDKRRAAALAVPRPPLPKNFSAARGRLVYPAAGRVVGRFGAPDENGTPRQGLTIETRQGATVVAPFAGEIEFAGPFHGYGQILIIAHGDGYHSLLAGLDRIDGTPGQRLVAGEPVGSMSRHQDKPRLYFELRHNNQPIDPLPWLATRVEKVNG